MKEFKGTPGPWGIRSKEVLSVGTKYSMTAMCYGVENTRIIAAAPELLEALQKYEEFFSEMFAQCCSNPVFDAWHKQVNAIDILNDAHQIGEKAIAKALGE